MRRNTSISASLLGRLSIGLVLGAAVVSGCSEKKKPAPQPPPPPPPKEPDPVTLSSLAQEMNADPRVQFADDVAIVEEPFARSVVSLADAIARGSGEKLRPMLDSTSTTVLQQLESDGKWGEETKKIEAIRVVYAGPPPSMDELMDTDEKDKDAAAPSEGAMKNMMAMAEKFKDLNLTPEEMAKLSNPATAQQALEELKAAGKITEEHIKQMQNAAMEMVASMSAEAGAMATTEVPDHAVILAVQDPSGAYLLGWTCKSAGESFRYSAAPSAPVTKTRASEFDSIGVAAFSIAKSAAWSATPPAAKPDSATPGSGSDPTKPSSDPASPSAPGKPAPAAPPAPAPEGTPPGKKNAPGGPINIPGSPPGS